MSGYYHMFVSRSKLFWSEGDIDLVCDLAPCLRLRWWRCLDWARSWLLSAPLCPLSDATPRPAQARLCLPVPGYAACCTDGTQETRSSELWVIKNKYLRRSFSTNGGLVVVMQSIATNIDLSLLWEFYFKVCQQCGSYLTLFPRRGPCNPHASWSKM